jgi:16S rRNA processing protein RimM
MGAHGVRGLVKLRSFTEDPHALFDYKTLSDEDGKRSFTVAFKNAMNDHFVATMDGVKNREDAEALRGVKLFIARSQLPKTKPREYYQADLAGLAVRDVAGKEYGKVIALHNFGGGPLVEFGMTKKDGILLPFSDAFVPDVDMKSGVVTINPPPGWLDSKEKPDEKN